MSRTLFVLLIALAACSHDATRENPLDPDLVSSPSIRVSVDDTLGSAAIEWSAFSDPDAFASYTVLRRVQGFEAADTLYVSTELADTAFVDETLQPGATYRFRVVATTLAGLAVPSDEFVVPAFAVAPVSLLAQAPDAQAGVVQLRWTSYGDAGFDSYVVVRRTTGLIDVDTLATIGSRTDTTFADTTVLHDVAYEYRVLVRTSFGDLASPAGEGVLSLPAVRITDLSMHSASATATLTWSRYDGPRFQTYRILRQRDGGEAQVVSELTDAGAVEFVDEGLDGVSEYSYVVEVGTSRGEALPSDAMSGRIHSVVDEWSLDVKAGDFVRLYSESEGIVSAVIAAPGRQSIQPFSPRDRIRVESFAANGRIEGEPAVVDGFRGLVLPSVAMARDEAGNRFISLRANPSASDDAVAIIALDEAGAPRFGPLVELFGEPLEMTVGDLPTWVRVRATTDVGAGTFTTDLPHIADLTITGEGIAPIRDRFVDPELAGWQIEGRSDASISFGRHLGDNNGVKMSLATTFGRGFAGSSLEIRNNIRLDVLGFGGKSHKFTLVVRPGLESSLEWLDEEERYSRLSSTFDDPRVLTGIPAQLFVSTEDRRFATAIRYLDAWSDSTVSPQWTAMLSAGSSVVLAAGEDGLAFNTEDLLAFEAQSSRVGLFAAAAGEIRVWERVASDGIGSLRVGACLPNQSRVDIGGARVRLGQPTFGELTEMSIGGTTGRNPGEFLFPISFDVGPDERIYVLDAGNARVQVFDHDGNYITQFGVEGSGPGQFDFVGGIDAADMAGSIAVNDDGFIYVADVGNGRIQKFAP